MTGYIVTSRFAAGALLLCRAETGSLFALMQQRSAEEHEPFTWTIFGGMAGPGEWPIGCMLREVREESGIDVGSFPLAHIHRFDASHEEFSFHTYVVMLPEMRAPVLSNESVNARWVRLGATAETLWDNMPVPLMKGMANIVGDPEVAARIIAFGSQI